MLTQYQIADVHPEHPAVPGTELALVTGLFRAKQRAIEIARAEGRAVAVWLWPESERLRKRWDRERVVPERASWVRYYSPGAPLVTADNARTIARLAAREDDVERGEATVALASLLGWMATWATDIECPAAAQAIEAALADVERAAPVRQAAAAEASAALGWRRWPREGRDGPPPLENAGQSTAA